jgi:Flp pilus assembly protein protease CpaA
MPADVRDLVLAALCAVAVYTDVTSGKIKNWLTFPVMVAGVVLAPLCSAHPFEGLLGLAAATAVGILFWRGIPALKPGDVKMLMAAGALLGPQGAIRAILLSAILFLPVGLVVLTIRGRLGNFLRIARGYLKDPTKRDPDATTIIHAPVIAAGIVAARLLAWPKLW